MSLLSYNDIMALVIGVLTSLNINICLYRGGYTRKIICIYNVIGMSIIWILIFLVIVGAIQERI